MTPNEKAAQLVVDNQLKVKSLDYKEAVQCAIVTVDEIMDVLYYEDPYKSDYWKQVKQVLENYETNSQNI